MWPRAVQFLIAFVNARFRCSVLSHPIAICLAFERKSAGGRWRPSRVPSSTADGAGEFVASLALSGKWLPSRLACSLGIIGNEDPDSAHRQPVSAQADGTRIDHREA